MNLLVKTVALSTLLVGGIIFLSKKSVAIESHSVRIEAIETKNASQDTAINETRENVRALAYIACTQARAEQIQLPVECGKFISMRR